MKELSSNTFYYKGTIGLILGPPLLAAFITFFWKNNFSDAVVNWSYAILLIFTIVQWFRWYHNRKVFYDGEQLLIKAYFSRKSQYVSVTDIATVKLLYNFSVKRERRMVKVVFRPSVKLSFIYFFRNSDKKAFNQLIDKVNNIGN